MFDQPQSVSVEAVERRLWLEYLDVLRAAVMAGKPAAGKMIWDCLTRLKNDRDQIRRRETILAQVHRKRYGAAPVRHRDDRDRELTRRIAEVKELLRLPCLPQPEDIGPTPEVLARPGRRDPIVSLLTTENIDKKEAAAARDIAKVKELMTVTAAAQVSRFDAGASYRSQSFSLVTVNVTQDIYLQYAQVYFPWEKRLADRDPDALRITLEVACDGIALDRARRNVGISWQSGLAHLKTGLGQYLNFWDRAGGGYDE